MLILEAKYASPDLGKAMGCSYKNCRHQFTGSSAPLPKRSHEAKINKAKSKYRKLTLLDLIRTCMTLKDLNSHKWFESYCNVSGFYRF